MCIRHIQTRTNQNSAFILTNSYSCSPQTLHASASSDFMELYKWIHLLTYLLTYLLTCIQDWKAELDIETAAACTYKSYYLVLGLLCFCKSNWTWICILTVGNSPQRNNRVVLDCWKIGRRKFATAERVISMSSWRSEYFQVTQCNSSSCRWLTVHWF